MEDSNNICEKSGTLKKAMIRITAGWIVLLMILFVTSGDLSWWQAWTYCGIILIPMTFFIGWAVKRDPAFLDRRFKIQEKERTQFFIQILGTPLLIALYIIPGFDYRFGWSNVPVAVSITGMVFLLGSYLMLVRVFLKNRWAGRTVETWGDQKVIDTGPYAIVRHPMYSGILIMLFATPLTLGSWWAILPSVSCIPVFVSRIINEEKILTRDLPGYGDYKAKIRYRLAPFLW